MFRSHDAVRPTVGLSEYHGDFWYRRFGVSIQQLGAVADDASKLLCSSGQEAGDVLKGQNRYVERVAEPHKPPGLIRRIDVEATGEVGWLIRNYADRPASDPRKADD